MSKPNLKPRHKPRHKPYAFDVDLPLDNDQVHRMADATIGGFYDQPHKYAEYEKALDNEQRIAYGKTIKQALKLLADCKNPKVSNLVKKIKARGIVIIFDGLGANKGQLYHYDRWEKRKGTKGATYEIIKTAAIKIDPIFRRSAIGVAGVIAHEMQHIHDMEFEKNVEKTPANKKLLSGVIGNIDNPRAQLRAQTFAGYVLKNLGFWELGPDEKIPAELMAELKQRWGSQWSVSAPELYTKLHCIEGFYHAVKNKPEGHRPVTRRCGCLCKNARYGLCDNKVYFPPCHLH